MVFYVTTNYFLLLIGGIVINVIVYGYKVEGDRRKYEWIELKRIR